MGIAETIQITRRQFGKMANLRSGLTHKVQVKTRYLAHMLEVEDVNFHHDSAVLLPDYGISQSQQGTTPEQERVAGLAVLYACYRHAREHPEQSALIVGHTDRSGSETYNQVLSDLRAANVLYALQGKRDKWVDIAIYKSKVEDYQQILIWLTHSLGWSCDPGGKTNVHDAKTRQAVKDFQTQYNQRFSASIGIDGGVGRQTWGAFFDVYMRELTYALGTDEAGLEEARKTLRFLKCEAIGCGEGFPITPDRAENYKTPADRRVEVLFFDPGEEPVVDCKAPKGACKELYEQKMYQVTAIPLDPLPLPSGVAVHVMLQFFYKDPDPAVTTDHALPGGFPVTIEYGDGTSEQKTLARDGKLEFFPLRAKQGFTVRFQFPQPHYLAAPPSGTAGPDELIKEAHAADYHRNKHFRLFKLPADWRLADSDWTVTGAATYDTTAHQFKQLDDMSITRIGSPAAPVKLVLDPHWQYLKLRYFDRFLKQRLSLPSMMVEAFSNGAAGGAPDVRSNWMTASSACQCMPWIVQTAPKPDRNVLIQFRTAPNTFVDSSADTVDGRRFVTKNAGASADAGLNVGASVNTDFNVANGQRLAFYDLPPVWKSRTYFARLSAGVGQPPAKIGLFEDLASEATTDDKPLLFSLDDIVLFEANSGGSLTTPLPWNKANDRLTIFCNTFRQYRADGTADAANLSTLGIYKPDTANGAAHLSQKVQMTDQRTDNVAYIGDYPDWVRLVVAQGNIFDVFDQRTPDAATGVVGARAGVRWLDLTTAPSFVPPQDTASGATGLLSPRPGPMQRPFCALHPFYELRHIRGTHVNPPQDQGTGRFDLILLRCCDMNADVETAVCLNYFRFFFNYSGFTAPHPLLTPPGQRQFESSAVTNIPRRWNGEDINAPGRAVVQPQAAPQNLRVEALYFAQPFASRAIAHFQLNVLPNGRAFMGSATGIGQLGQNDNAPFSTAPGVPPNPGFPIGAFTAAHENGHGAGLGDEYLESSFSASYFQNGVYSNIDGGPYMPDTPSMMCNSMRQITGRYYWHIAEWLFWLTGRDCEVVHNGFTYRLPHHPNILPRSPARPPVYTFMAWPLQTVQFTSAVNRAACDQFIHLLGAEQYSRQGLVPGRPSFNAVMMILVKMRFTIHTNNHNAIRNLMGQIDAAVNGGFNGGGNRWVVRGTVNGQSFNRCLLFFQPRYLVDTFSGNANYAQSVGIANTNAAYQTRVNQIISNHTVPFRITTQNGGGSSWTATRNLTFDASNPGNFSRFFAEMLGLNPANLNVAATYVPLVRQIIPGVTAADITPA